MQVSYELMQIETTYGDTDVVITGTVNKRALVFLHEVNACNPIACEILKNLANDFQIYVIVLATPQNQSSEFQLNFHNNSYGKWMYEILSRLAIQNALLFGCEFGGFVALKTLTFDEKRIAKTFLVAPTGIVKPGWLSYFLKIFHSRKQLKNANRTLDVFAIPRIIEKETLKIKTPLYIFTSGNDVFYSSQRLQKRATKLFPSLKETIVLDDTKIVEVQKRGKTIAEKITKIMQP